MNGESLVVAVLGLLGTFALVVPILISLKHRRVVTENSAALVELHSLNESYQQRLSYSGPITYHWEDRVSSKAKFDRYDLKKFYMERLAVLEAQIQRQIAVQVKDAAVYAEYRHSYQQLSSKKLGGSASDEVDSKTFARIEQKFFTKRGLREPVCAAQARCTVPSGTPVRRERTPTPSGTIGTSSSFGMGSLKWDRSGKSTRQRSSFVGRNATA